MKHLSLQKIIISSLYKCASILIFSQFNFISAIRVDMTRFKETVVLALCALLAIAYGFQFPVEDKHEYHPIKDNKHDEFDWALFKTSAVENKGKNVLISPYSVKILLSVLAEAAVAETKKEFRNVLPQIKPKFVRQYYRKILTSLTKKNSAYKMYQGTNLYIKYSVSPGNKFVKNIKKYYNTSTCRVNFEDSDRTANIINKWVEHVTQEHIKDLVSPDKIKALAAVLVNAIYFKGTWEKQFDPEWTLKGKFKVNATNLVDVQIMTMSGKHFYYLKSSELKAELLRMPYKGEKYAMTFILPEPNEEIDNVIARIKPGLIQNLQRQLSNTTIDIYIPKFKFDSTSHFKKAIKSLNIKKVFEQEAELPRLGKGIVLSDVIQKAGVAVDEIGTETYAATEVELADRMSTKQFSIDRPFVFFIEDEDTGALLFAGKVLDPAAS